MSSMARTLSTHSSSSSVSSPSKERTYSGESQSSDEPTITIKTEDPSDEVRIYSASTLLKTEVEDDVDVDGIEDRLSPVVEEPSSPTKPDSSATNVPGLYPPAFLYPYFHPMWNPYLMAAAAQSQTSGSSTDPKAAGEAPLNPNFGGPTPFSGMPFPGLCPPGMTGPPYQANLFNPFGIPIPTPGVRPPPPSNRPAPSSAKDLNALLEAKRPRKPHIKKPLNAFMIFMKEQRARVIEECTLKESSAINKVLGQKWKELPRSEQDRYYELAKEERNRHMQLYPGWSARDNYGLKKKRTHPMVSSNPQKKMMRESHESPLKQQTKMSMPFDNDCLAQKKCRARYGLEGLSQWCKHCRRKKKCTRFLEDDSGNQHSGSASNQGNPSSISSPGQSDNDESINDFDSDDILSRQIDSIEDDEQDDSDEENQHHSQDKQQTQPHSQHQQQHHHQNLQQQHHSKTMDPVQQAFYGGSQFFPRFTY